MRRTLMYSLIGLVGCTWLAGCQEKPEGAQTIIVELADPSDQQETEATNEEESQDGIGHRSRRNIQQYGNSIRSK